MLKMLDTEFRKIKRQKFVLLTILAACLFPIPLTVVIPVPKWKLLGAKVLVIYILAIFYGVAAIGATMIGGFLTGTVSDIPLKLAISLSMSVLIATATLPMITVKVIFSVIYAIVSLVFSIMLLKVPAPLTLLFRCSLPFMTANPERMEIVESVQNWVLPVFPCILVLIGIGIICMALSAYFYQKQVIYALNDFLITRFSHG